MEDTADFRLKQQFLLLQEQQQIRLQMRLQRKEEKDKQNKANTAHSAANAPSLSAPSGSSFGVNDALDLEMTETNPSGSSYLSEELVEHLNTQIREMKDENGRLYKLLSEKDFEIKQLKKKKNDEKMAVMESQLTNETAATKIVELSKKIRELTAELESERTKSKQFQRKCQELQLQISDIAKDKLSKQNSTYGSVISLQSVVTEPKEENAVDVKAIQDKLKQTEMKMAEFRNQCQILKQEVKVAHKVLAQELGENVNVQSILNNASNFRGRAQQILTLQNKVDELKGQLAAQEPPSLESELLGNKTSKKRTQDEKYREELRRLEKERKELQERETAERKALEEDYQNLKQRMEAAKARNKVLSEEVKTLKHQMQTLLQKGHNDDELIAALMKQQSQLKDLLVESNQQIASTERKREELAKQLSQRSQQDNNIVNQLKDIIADRDVRIGILEKEFGKQKSNSYQIPEVGLSQTPLMPAPVSSRQSTQDSIAITVVTPASGQHQSRPSSELRDTSSGFARPPNITKLPLGSSRGEKTTAGELQYQNQEYHALLQAANVECDRLSELLHVTQKRLNSETQTVTDLQAELLTVRRQNVELEKKIGRQELEKTAGPGKKKGASRVKSSTAGCDAPAENLDLVAAASSGADVHEIVAMMDIQKDEVDALKAALQRTLQAKEDDLNLFSKTINETKQVFLQALRQLKQTKFQT